MYVRVATALGGLGQDTVHLVREVNRSASVLPGDYSPYISALPQTCHHPLAGERLPLATSSPTPPSICGWGHLNPPPTHRQKKKILLLFFMCVVFHRGGTLFHVCSFCFCFENDRLAMCACANPFSGGQGCGISHASDKGA